MTDPIRVHIRSKDGHWWETTVTDQDGRDIGAVTAVTWSCKVGELSTATITLEDVSVDVGGLLLNESPNV